MRINHDYLVDMVKACGQEFIDQAENIVGETNSIIGLDIRVRIPTDGKVPSINVTRESLVNNSINVIMENRRKSDPEYTFVDD